MVTRTWAFGLVLITTILITVAQYFLKTGVSTFPEVLLNIPLIIGVLIYAVGSVFMILAFKGGEVSVLYPVIATSYIWVALISLVYLNESITPLRWIGIAIVIVGITAIGFGSKKKSGGSDGN